MIAPAMHSEIIDQIKQHFDTIITHGTAQDGPDPNPMWMASLDVRTGRYPENDLRPAHISPRVDSYTHAPGGATLYWDQPHLVAAHNLSDITGDQRYAEAANAYIRAFLQRSVANCDLFLWGNHYYYDVYQGETVWFRSHTPPRPTGVHAITAYLHEIRPVPPAWELFWWIDPKLTKRSLDAIGRYHVFDPATGGFNRHADQQPGLDYLEAGGILVESLAWLYTRTRERSAADLALRIARFTFEHRAPLTGLIPVSSMAKSWERYTSTTEIGLWANSLLRAAQYTNLSQFHTMARDVVAAYLTYGWDAADGRYYGRLNIADGTPQRDEDPADKISAYQPDTYTDIWNALYPSHDYPLALAEACVTLYEQTGQPEFRTAIYRWAALIAELTYEGAPVVRYAEQFGRAIHFLLRAADVLEKNRFRVQAVDIADVAVSGLFAGRMFRSHTGEDRYDAVDGLGYLLLALLYLETRQPPNYMGFGF